VNRRQVVTGSVLGIAALAVRASAADAAPVRVIAGGSEVSLGVQYAQMLGLYAKYGVSAQVQYVNNGEAAVAAVVGGAGDVGVANTMSFAIAHEKGLDLKLFVPGGLYAQSEPTTALVVAGTSELRGPKDFAGKTIALPALSGIPQISTETWLERSGVDAKSVRFIEMPLSRMGSAVAGKVVDAAVITEPALTNAQMQQGVRILSLPFGEVASRFFINGWYGRRDWIAANRDTARRFARAVIEGQLWANTHLDESGQILTSVLKIDPAVVARMRRAKFTSRFEPGLLQPVIDLAAQHHDLANKFPATELYENLA
jgi:NitT/TauT family transport system substrate-binding protein